MKFQQILIPLLILTTLVLAIGWHWGRQQGRLEVAAEAAARKIDDHENRLALLEQEHEKRGVFRGRVKVITDRVLGFLGF